MNDKLEKHHTVDELEDIIKESYKDTRLFHKLMYIRLIMKGKGIAEAADLMFVSRNTGAKWVKKYNAEGIEGLKIHYGNQGRKSKLTPEQIDELREMITEEDTTLSIQKMIREHYGIDYSRNSIPQLMKNHNINYR